LQLLGGVVAGSFVVAKVANAGLSMVIAGGVMLAIYVIALRLLRVKEVDTVFSSIRGIVRR
jgi:hypothetical protein